MLNNTFSLLILIPFILGFITYEIRTLLHPTSTAPDPVTVKISPEAMQQLRRRAILIPILENSKIRSSDC